MTAMYERARNYRVALLALFFSSCFLCRLLSLEEPQNWTQWKSRVLSNQPSFHGWCTPQKSVRLMELIYRNKPQICVEVGVFGGSSLYPTAAALQYNNKGIVYAIDPWAVDPCLEGMDGVNADWWSSVDLVKIMHDFMDKMHRYGVDSRYCVMRMTSKESVNYFGDNSVDILHIDGNHSEESALFDVKSWLPKVKSGGYIWFDDVNWPQTAHAVSYLMNECELDPSCLPEDTYLLFKKK